jgi:hypothetical protein
MMMHDGRSDLNDLHTLFKDVATLAQMQQEVMHIAPYTASYRR